MLPFASQVRERLTGTGFAVGVGSFQKLISLFAAPLLVPCSA